MKEDKVKIIENILIDKMNEMNPDCEGFPDRIQKVYEEYLFLNKHKKYPSRMYKILCYKVSKANIKDRTEFEMIAKIYDMYNQGKRNWLYITIAICITVLLVVSFIYFFECPNTKELPAFILEKIKLINSN